MVADGGHRPVGAACRRRVVACVGASRSSGRPAHGLGSLAEQPAAQALLTVLAATADGLDGGRALTLLTGPIGRVDPVPLRQLRRALRRGEIDGPPREFDDTPAKADDGRFARLIPTQARPLRWVRAALDAAARSHARGEDLRYTLWAAWHRSGLQRRWLAACERGGHSGVQAGRDLDAVTALFDATDQYCRALLVRRCPA